jgi:hypothetical protein
MVICGNQGPLVAGKPVISAVDYPGNIQIPWAVLEYPIYSANEIASQHRVSVLVSRCAIDKRVPVITHNDSFTEDLSCHINDAIAQKIIVNNTCFLARWLSMQHICLVPRKAWAAQRHTAPLRAFGVVKVIRPALQGLAPTYSIGVHSGTDITMPGLR